MLLMRRERVAAEGLKGRGKEGEREDRGGGGGVDEVARLVRFFLVRVSILSTVLRLHSDDFEGKCIRRDRKQMLRISLSPSVLITFLLPSLASLLL